jgi:lysozyme family protein
MADAFEAGFKFFLGPQYDGHLHDRAPGEKFDTAFGVTEMTYAGALAKGIVSKPFDQITTPDDVAPIYRAMYYDANRCGEMPAPVAMILFVDATLMGLKTPAKNLQEVVGAVADGAIGPATLAAVKKSDAAETARRLDAADLAHLKSLPNWSQFGRGWGNREADLLTHALALA